MKTVYVLEGSINYGCEGYSQRQSLPPFVFSDRADAEAASHACLAPVELTGGYVFSSALAAYNNGRNAEDYALPAPYSAIVPAKANIFFSLHEAEAFGLD